MTRKDYELIAKALSSGPDELDAFGAPHCDYIQGIRDAKVTYANAIAGTLAADNPRFDRERFLKACGI